MDKIKKAKKNPHSIFHPHIFYGKLFRTIMTGVGLIFLLLLIGMFGYQYFEGMNWEDSFLSASMILSGMGPVGALKTTAGKIFAGFYALFSGLVFIMIIGLVFSPVVHRFFVKIHIDDEDDDAPAPKKTKSKEK